MLILSRKEEESIFLGKDIEIVVVSIGEGKVKLGIKAPREVDIVRSEVKKAIEDENKMAMSNLIVEKLKSDAVLKKQEK